MSYVANMAHEQTAVFGGPVRCIQKPAVRDYTKQDRKETARVSASLTGLQGRQSPDPAPGSKQNFVHTWRFRKADPTSLLVKNEETPTGGGSSSHLMYGMHGFG